MTLNKEKSDSQSLHAKIIIDQMMWRMAAMDRFSDEGKIIIGDALQPLDVVALNDEYGGHWFGIVQKTATQGELSMPMAVCVNDKGVVGFVTDMGSLFDMPMRCIFEDEGVKAAAALLTIYGGENGKA